MAPSRPSRFRPYRIAMVVIFFLFAGVPALLFFRSVIATLGTGAPPHQLPTTESGELPAACASRARALRLEISDHFDALRAMASNQGSAGLRRWQAYLVSFGARLDAARETCSTDPASARQTTHLFDALDDLARITNAVATRLFTDEGDNLAQIEKAFSNP